MSLALISFVSVAFFNSPNCGLYIVSFTLFLSIFLEKRVQVLLIVNSFAFLFLYIFFLTDVLGMSGFDLLLMNFSKFISNSFVVVVGTSSLLLVLFLSIISSVCLIYKLENQQLLEYITSLSNAVFIILAFMVSLILTQDNSFEGNYQSIYFFTSTSFSTNLCFILRVYLLFVLIVNLYYFVFSIIFLSFFAIFKAKTKLKFKKLYSPKQAPKKTGDSYNEILNWYYGKTLDSLFEKDNAVEKTNKMQIPISNEIIYQNSSDSNLNKESPNSHEKAHSNSSPFMLFNEDMPSNKDINPEEIPSLPPELETSLDILLSDKVLEKDVFTITEKVKQVDEQKQDVTLTLTEKIQIKYSLEISKLCWNAKNIYNFGNFVMRTLFFIKNKNPNCSWNDFLKIRQSIMPDPSIKNYTQKRQGLLGAFDKLEKGIKYTDSKQIKNSLVTLLKFNKFYKKPLYAVNSQQILRVLGSNWASYFALRDLFFEGELDEFPGIPRYLDSNGEFTTIYTSQLFKNQDFFSHIEQTKKTTKYKKYEKTTAEMLFPPRHRHLFPHVRVRYEILQNLKEVRVIPRGTYYEIEIRYERPIEDCELCQERAVSIDLGVNNPIAMVNNLGLQPILLRGRELKRANHLLNSKSPYYRSSQDVYRDIFKKFKTKTILQIIKEKTQKYIKDYQWKEKVANIVLKNPTMIYDQFKTLHGENRELKHLFNYLKKLIDKKAKNKNPSTPIADYLYYEEIELNRKLRVCNDLKYDLEGRSAREHFQRLEDIQQQNQTILDRFFKTYNNKTRDAIHKLSRYIINYCKYNEIGTIIIGYNEGWKTRSKLSKTINRKFISLPFYKLIESIKYKALLCGITVIVQEESYTSKCSAIDKESIEFHINYAGMRNPTILGRDGESHKHYGQFYSKVSNKYIHSDINGAFNIGRKARPDLFENISQRQMMFPPRKKAVT